MGTDYYALAPDGASDDQMAAIAGHCPSCDGHGGIICCFGYGCADILDALRETQEGFSYGDSRTVVTAASIAWAGPLAKRMRASDAISCVCLMPDDDGAAALSDWLGGVTSRRTISADVPIPRSVTMPDARCVLDRDAEYWHASTLRERMEGRDAASSGAPSFDVRPTVTVSPGRADIALSDETVTADIEERDPRLALASAMELEHVLGCSGWDPYVRANARSLLLESPQTMLSLANSLSGVFEGLKAAGLETFVIERA